MAQSSITAEAIYALIQSREENITHRANRVSAFELSSWSEAEVASLLAQISPKPNTPGNNEPCGPDVNRPSPMTDWMFTFVKAPLPFIQQSIRQQSALCVNRLGKFQVRTDNYAVMSHVWGETCGWNTPTDWGPIDPELRKKGIIHRHFLRFFDKCEVEWLWVDILATPEVFDDMTAAEKAETEELRTGVINSLRNVYMRADKVVCLDGLLMRLHSGGVIDVAIVLCLGRWIERLWPFTETKLAKRVILKTEDSTFDLDEILLLLYKIVNNENHRYFNLLTRLRPLRPAPDWLGSPPSNPRGRELFSEIYCGCENRQCDVSIDQARALFPVLDLKWQTGWTLDQGLKHIAGSCPDAKDVLQNYCRYRNIDFQL